MGSHGRAPAAGHRDAHGNLAQESAHHADQAFGRSVRISREPHPQQRPSARRRADARGLICFAQRKRTNQRSHRASAQRHPARGSAQFHHHRTNSTAGGGAFRRASGRHDEQTPPGQHRLSAASGDVPRARVDQIFPQRNRRRLWRARSRHGFARLQAREKADEGAGQHSPDDFVHRQLVATLSACVRLSGCLTKSEALHLKRVSVMKFSVTKEKLLEGLQQVQNVVSTRTTLPILSNVLLQANGSEVHVTTTDLDVGVRGSFEAQVEKEGATTLRARRLFNIVRELPSSEIQIDVDGKNAASIRSGQSFFKILGLPEEEFPPLPKFENAKVVTIRQKDLRDGLRKTSYAISTDEPRYVLNGLLFSLKENKLTLVATDGRRLAMVDIELEFPRSHEADIIVPTKAVTELGRLLMDDGEVKMSIGSGQIAFELNNTLLVSKLIEGNYPNYKQVIPTETKERVTLERETFLNSLRRVSLLASDKSNSIKLNFTKNNIDITANTPEVGEAKEALPVTYKGREFSIAFNPEFLMAPLRNLTEDEVFLDLIDEMSPGVLKIQTPFLYVLMPMRISS